MCNRYRILLIISLLPLAQSVLAQTRQQAAPTEVSDSVPDTEDYDTLDEVTVQAKKPLVQTKPNKVIYNTEEDPSASTSSVIDAMRKVPMLSVDSEGNLKLKGNNDFKIFINGKPDPALSANYKEILKAMPASTVKKIEVWTEPGAKYDAEGTGGIINIVTETSSKMYGYTATIEASATNRNVSGSVSAMTKINNFSASVNYSHAYNFDQKMHIGMKTRYLENMTDQLSELQMEANNKGHFDQGSLQLSWEPDTVNLLTVSANLYSWRQNAPMSSVSTMRDADGNLRWGYSSSERRKGVYSGLTAGVNYQRNFSGQGHNIVFAYQYNYGLNHSENASRYYGFINYDPSQLPDRLNDMRYPSHEHTFQADYTLPLGRIHLLETGLKYIMRRNYGKSEYSLSGEDGVWIPDDSQTVDLHQFQDVAAVYGSYSGRFGLLTATAGLRYEFTHMGAKFKTPGYTDYTQNLNDVVPNASLSYMLTSGSSLTASYQMRISRPSVNQLDPYRDTSVPLRVKYGNPDLTSQKTNGATLTYSNFALPVGLNFSAGYSRTSDIIVDYTLLGPDNVLEQTYGNLGSCDEVNMFGFMRWSPVNNLAISVNGGAYYKNYRARKANMHNDGWGWNAGANIDWTLPHDMQLSIYGGAGDMGATLQSDGALWHYDGLAFSKQFLKEKRLKISLTASNIITPKLKMDMTTRMAGAVSDMNYSMQAWSVGISVSYRIGTLRAQMKQTAKSIHNNDLQSGGSSGMGGISTPAQPR